MRKRPVSHWNKASIFFHLFKCSYLCLIRFKHNLKSKSLNLGRAMKQMVLLSMITSPVLNTQSNICVPELYSKLIFEFKMNSVIDLKRGFFPLLHSIGIKIFSTLVIYLLHLGSLCFGVSLCWDFMPIFIHPHYY